MSAVVRGVLPVSGTIAALMCQNLVRSCQYDGFGFTICLFIVPCAEDARLAISVNEGGMVVLVSTIQNTYQNTISCESLWKRTLPAVCGFYVCCLTGFVKAIVEAALFLHTYHAGVAGSLFNLVNRNSYHGNVSQVR